MRETPDAPLRVLHVSNVALDPRTPVIVGVGVASQQPDEPGRGREALELMLDATRAAGEDSGAPAILNRVRHVGVPHGTWSYSDPGRIIAERIGAVGARTSLVATGIPQQTLLDDAYAAIRDGTLDVALVVGGEAARRAALARRHGVGLVETIQNGVTPDDFRLPSEEIVSQVEIASGMSSAMEPFAIIDSALRVAEGRSLAEHRDEIARLWAGFSRVASRNPQAAFPEPREAEFLREPSKENRPIAFPYNKWHCAQMNVDQAAAIVVCSLEAARRSGVDSDRIVFPLVALESSFSLWLPYRRDLHRWPAMEVLGKAAEAHLGYRLRDVELVELYSCFPAAVRVQQRALGLPLDGIPTVTGGESFAGGPWNNFVLQATAAVIERLRVERGATGVVTTLSGIVNKPGLAVYSTEAGAKPLLLGDLCDGAGRATPRVDAITGYRGPARVAAYTVTYEGFDPAKCTIIADTADGRRCMATADDSQLARRATIEELIGTAVAIDGGRFEV